MREPHGCQPLTLILICRESGGSPAPVGTARVAGIVSGANGLGSGVRLGVDAFDHDVALAGRVYCNVDATEAGIGLREHAFHVLGWDEVISVIQPGNLASIRVAQKVGEDYWKDWSTPGGVRVRLYRVGRDGVSLSD